MDALFDTVNQVDESPQKPANPSWCNQLSLVLVRSRGLVVFQLNDGEW